MKLCNHVLALLVAAAAFNSDHAAGQELRQCEFEVKARCASGQARVTIADGMVMRIEIDMSWCGQRGRPGYTCTIDSSRGEKESRWSEDGGATLIANASPFNPSQPDRVKVTVGTNVSIDFKEAQSIGRCGAGAELPQAIIFPARGKKCRVWLQSP